MSIMKGVKIYTLLCTPVRGDISRSLAGGLSPA